MGIQMSEGLGSRLVLTPNLQKSSHRGNNFAAVLRMHSPSPTRGLEPLQSGTHGWTSSLSPPLYEIMHATLSALACSSHAMPHPHAHHMTHLPLVGHILLHHVQLNVLRLPRDEMLHGGVLFCAMNPLYSNAIIIMNI